MAAEKPKSVILAAEKARSQRVARVKVTLQTRLDNPIAIVDALMSELTEGDPHEQLWEELHGASMRDGQEANLADAYNKCSNSPRMKRMTRQQQAAVFMHAADFFQGVLGDAVTTERFLERVLQLMPEHADAFNRLERRLEKLLDARRILELYALVAGAPPKPINILSTQAFNRVLQLNQKDPLSDEACRKLIVLVPTNARLLDAIEAHCRATKRPALACELIEQALLDESAGVQVNVDRRQRLLDLYMGEAAMPDRAIGHFEALLAQNPANERVIKVGDRLLSVPSVSSRAATALQTARRARGGGGV